MIGSREPASTAGGLRSARIAAYMGRSAAAWTLFAPLTLLALGWAAPSRVMVLAQRIDLMQAVAAGVFSWFFWRFIARLYLRGSGPRFSIRLASALAWVTPAVFIAQAWWCPFISFARNAEWLIVPQPLLGYPETIALVPRGLYLGLFDLALPAWTLQMMVTIASVVLLAGLALKLLKLAAASPASPARKGAIAERSVASYGS